MRESKKFSHDVSEFFDVVYITRRSPWHCNVRYAVQYIKTEQPEYNHTQLQAYNAEIKGHQSAYVNIWRNFYCNKKCATK